MRILLVTDYCAKGSLYDIIENEDIKLDELFIASLVHDLIRVTKIDLHLLQSWL
jgi:guanylate cyclase, other